MLTGMQRYLQLELKHLKTLEDFVLSINTLSETLPDICPPQGCNVSIEMHPDDDDTDVIPPIPISLTKILTGFSQHITLTEHLVIDLSHFDRCEILHALDFSMFSYSEHKIHVATFANLDELAPSVRVIKVEVTDFTLAAYVPTDGWACQMSAAPHSQYSFELTRLI